MFCEIVAGNIPSTKVYEDDMILAFKDINPVAPVHIIVIPKEHIDSANGVSAENSAYVARIFEKIPEIAKSQGIDSYRIINNCGDDAGQTVMHLHFHIVGGVKLGEKII
ncbi:MAG: histidine triad nucleotide-binding protein [Acetobacter sp.]|nr:histidine triad nucleotide-binding protein [Bacteroides sp.]MCM1341378.1 histidine triad nucleotide-binding protein [Acetobacter sp.]